MYLVLLKVSLKQSSTVAQLLNKGYTVPYIVDMEDEWR